MPARKKLQVRQAPESDPDAPRPPTPQQYRDFVGSIELLDVRLAKAQASSTASRFEAESLTVRLGLETKAGASKKSGDVYQFEVQATLDARVLKLDAEKQVGRINATFSLRYSSQTKPSAELLDVFSNVNVPVNAWPYLREFVQQTVTRFGWTPLVLPTLNTVRQARDHK